MSFAPRHILVPVALLPEDDIRLAEQLVDAACDLALPFSARVTLLTVAPPQVMPVTLAPEIPSPVVDWYAQVVSARDAAARKHLETLSKRASERGVQVTTVVLTDPGPIADTIAHAAQDLLADAVVVSTHGRKGLQRILLGSVAERVAHLCTVPVLLVRPA